MKEFRPGQSVRVKIRATTVDGPATGGMLIGDPAVRPNQGRPRTCPACGGFFYAPCTTRRRKVWAILVQGRANGEPSPFSDVVIWARHNAWDTILVEKRQPVTTKCVDCGAEFETDEQSQSCPKCGSVRLTRMVQLAGTAISATAARATMTVIQHWERLLQTAEELYRAGYCAAELYKPGYFGAALIVAQTACEVVVELAIDKALRTKKVPELVEPIDQFVLTYSVKNERLRRLYEALTNDMLAGDKTIGQAPQPFWSRYCDTVKDRNACVHSGVAISQAKARAGVDAANEFVNHVVQHNGLP
jgi:DNA-directed RNA polymerase subunit RPC12/RpoP